MYTDKASYYKYTTLDLRQTGKQLIDISPYLPSLLINCFTLQPQKCYE